MKSAEKILSVLFVCFLFFSLSCKKKQEEARKKKERFFASQPAVIPFPEGVIAYGGARGFDELFKSVTDIVSSFEPNAASTVVPFVKMGVQTGYGLKNLDWVDGSKPVYFAIYNPKEINTPDILLFPFKTRELLDAALPENKTKGTDGNELTYPAMDQSVFLNFVGNYAVFSKEARLYPKLKDFLSDKLASLEFQNLIDVQVSVKNIRTIYSEEIQSSSKEILEQNGTEEPLPRMKEMVKSNVNLILDLVNQTEVAVVSLKLDGKLLTLPFKLLVQQGGRIEKFVASSKDRKLETLKYTPSDSWLVFSSNIDPKAFTGGWSKLGIEALQEIHQMTPVESAKVALISDELMKLTSGDSTFAMFKEGGNPAGLITIAAVANGEEYSKKLFEFYSLLFTKFGTFITEVAREKGFLDSVEFKKLSFESFPAFLKSAEAILDPLGIKLAVKNEKYKDLTIDYVELTLDYEKLPKLSEEDQKVLDALKSNLGNRAAIATAYDKGNFYLAIGIDTVGTLKKVYDAPGIGGEQFSGVLKTAPENTIMLGYVSLPSVLGAFSVFLPELSAAKASIETLQSKEVISFALGGKGNTLEAHLSLPLDQIAEVAKVMK